MDMHGYSWSRRQQKSKNDDGESAKEAHTPAAAGGDGGRRWDTHALMAQWREIPERVAGGRVEHLVEVLLQAVHGVQGRRDPPLHLYPLELRHLDRRRAGAWLLRRRRCWRWRDGVDGGEAVQLWERAERRVEHPRIELLGARVDEVRPVHLAGVRWCAAAAAALLHGAVAAVRAAAAAARATTSTTRTIAIAIACGCDRRSGRRRRRRGGHLHGCGAGGAGRGRGGGPGLLELLVVEDSADADGERAVRRDAWREVGARLGAAEEARGLVVGARGGVSGLEGAEPHADLLRRVLDLRHPPPRRPLPDADELAVARAALLPPPRLRRLRRRRRRRRHLLAVVVAVVLQLEHWRLHLEVELHVFVCELVLFSWFFWCFGLRELG